MESLLPELTINSVPFEFFTSVADLKNLVQGYVVHDAGSPVPGPPDSKKNKTRLPVESTIKEGST